MRHGGRLALSCLVFALVVAGADAGAQHFGRNKVEYVDFDFKVLETEHFDVHYASGQKEAAALAARMAERWYARLSRLLDHQLGTRQPLILYGSQPEFAQTNVVSSFLGEGIGGVTESARRRIVMPFAPTLAETDQILGHEIVHAFQFDITRRQRGGLAWPLWAVEGMAQYLSLGTRDPEAAAWLRDAVRSDLLPENHRETEQRFSPYRYGHAMWAYLAGRFGDGIVAGTLKTPGSIEKRVQKITGAAIKQLHADWREASRAHYGAADTSKAAPASLLVRDSRHGRFHLGPALSPDGHRAVFFSERDRLSLDMFVADTSSGSARKLLTTAGSARFESLQAIRSAGSWNPGSDRFVFAAIEQGQPALIVLDMQRGKEERTIKLPQLGQILTPSWSPDGRAIAFSALEAGSTDLYLYDLDTNALHRLTNDLFSDLQPAWSPDGRRLAFATDRFTTTIASLTFGAPELALLDVATGDVRRLPAFESASHANPQWSGADDVLYFLADPSGVRNVYRMDVTTGELSQITDVAGGVTGLAPSSPALSVARHAPVLAYTVYRAGKYQVELRRGTDMLTGRAISLGAPSHATTLPPAVRADDAVDAALADGNDVSAPVRETRTKPYRPDLFIEAVGHPSLSSGGGPFGTFWRGGGSLLFSDLLGERKLLTYVQVSSRLRETAFGVRYLNRERRWNWGATAELQPSLRRLPRRRVGDEGGEPAVTREMLYFDRSQLRVGGYVAYPFNQGQRVELDAGIRHTRYREGVVSSVRSLHTGRLLSSSTTFSSDHGPSTVGEISAALVGDTAVFGPAGPILGGRYRYEVASSVGELSVTRVVLDHRRYLMPVKPYTIATRVLHTGYYGPDVDDPRLLPGFLGSRQFVRGYGWSSLRCPRDVDGECGAYDDLLGSRLLVGNLEVRFPIMGILARDIRYGALPLEGFLFADTGVVWSRSPIFTAASADRHVVGSFGAGVRLAAFIPVELAVVRAMSRPARGWSFDISVRTAF